MSSPPKDVTLSGLAPLSNPVAFWVYASLFLGCVTFGYTVLIASGAWIFVVVSFISLASTVRGMRRARSYRLPPEATVDTVNIIGGALNGTLAACAYFVFVDGFSVATLMHVATSAAGATAALILAIAAGEGRSPRHRLRPSRERMTMTRTRQAALPVRPRDPMRLVNVTGLPASFDDDAARYVYGPSGLIAQKTSPDDFYYLADAQPDSAQAGGKP